MRLYFARNIHADAALGRRRRTVSVNMPFFPKLSLRARFLIAMGIMFFPRWWSPLARAYFCNILSAR